MMMMMLFNQYELFVHVTRPLFDVFLELWSNKQYASGQYDGYSRAVNDVKMSTDSYSSSDIDKLQEFSMNRKKPDENATMKDKLGTNIKVLLLPTWRISLFCQSFILRQSIHPFPQIHFLKYFDSDEYDEKIINFFSGTFTKEFIKKTKQKIQQDYEMSVQNKIDDVVILLQ